MPISVRPLPLELKHAFRIAHGSSTQRNNALVQIGPGFGEAALPPYYPTSFDDVNAYVNSIADLLEDAIVQQHIPIVSLLESLPEGPAPARAAVDMALHDLWGQRLNSPLYRLFGLNPSMIPASSYALPIPLDLKELDDQLKPVLHFPFLKLKIGSGNPEYDKAIVRRTREQYSGHLCVDVNGAWSIDVAVRMIPAMNDFDLLFIEQPIAAGDTEDWHLLKRLLPDRVPPLIADESVQGLEDLFELAGAVKGVNIKLAKCGGIHEARKMICLARSLDLSVMLGCMIESSVALTAAAHLSPLVDFLDLDGQLHLANDPFDGLSFDAGLVTLPETAGLGVHRAGSVDTI